MIAVIEDFAFWTAQDDKDAMPELKHLPSRARRKLSQLTRMVLDIGYRLCSKNNVEDVVFASRYGELGRQLEISDGILAEGEVSPSTFGYSVFNTPVALLSLHQGLRGRSRALYAGDESLQIGLVQAVLSLARSSSGQVLFLYGNERIPQAYREVEEEDFPPQVLGLVLRRGDGGAGGGVASLSVSVSDGGSQVVGDVKEAAELSSWLETGTSELCWPCPGSNLLFQKFS